MPDKPHIATDRLRLFMEDLAAVMVTHGLVISPIIDDTNVPEDEGPISGRDYRLHAFSTFQVSPIRADHYEVPDGIVVWDDGTLAVQEVDAAEGLGLVAEGLGLVSVRFPETAHGRLKAAARVARLRADGVAP